MKSCSIKRMMAVSKQPGFSEESWAPLAVLADVDAFERVGNFKEVMNWTEYVRFLTNWAPAAEWDCSFKRISECGNLVFLELEERTSMGAFRSVVNSMTLYDFNEAGKIRRLDVYLQMALPEGGMLSSYDGVRITG